MLNDKGWTIKKKMKTLEQAKHGLIAAIAIYVDPVLRMADFFLYNMTSMSDEDLLLEMKERIELCQHFRKELEWLECHDDADGDSSPETDESDDHLNWLLQKRRSRRISQLKEENRQLAPVQRDSFVSCRCNPTGVKDELFFSALKKPYTVLRNEVAADESTSTLPESTSTLPESTSTLPEDKRHIAFIQVGKESFHPEEIYAEKPPMKTKSFPKSSDQKDPAGVVNAKDSVKLRTENESEVSLTKRLTNDDVPTMRYTRQRNIFLPKTPMQRARDMHISAFIEEGDNGSPTLGKEMSVECLPCLAAYNSTDGNVSLEKENIFQSTQRHSCSAHVDGETRDLQDDMTFVALINKERSHLKEANPSEISTGEKDSVTFRESNLPGKSSANTFMNEQILRHRQENSLSTFVEQTDFGECVLIQRDDFSAVPNMLQDSDLVIMVRRAIPRSKEENAWRVSFEECNSEISREISLNRRIENSSGWNMFKRSNSVSLRDNKRSQLGETKPLGASVEEHEFVTTREISSKGRMKNSSAVPSAIQSSDTVLLRNTKISRLREENPSGASVLEQDFVTIKEISSKERIKNSSEVMSWLQSSDFVLLRDGKISRLREENPSGASVEEQDFVTTRKISSKGRIKNSSEVPSWLQSSDFVLLRDGKISRLREENPSGASVEEQDFVTTREVSSKGRIKNSSAAPSSLQCSNSILMRDEKTSPLREENPSKASTEGQASVSNKENSSYRKEISPKRSCVTRDLYDVDPQTTERNISSC